MGQTLLWDYTTSDNTNNIEVGECWSCTFLQVSCLLLCYFQNTTDNRALQYRLEYPCDFLNEWNRAVKQWHCKTKWRELCQGKRWIQMCNWASRLVGPGVAASLGTQKMVFSHSTTASWEKSSHLTLDISVMRCTPIKQYLIWRRINELRKCLFIYWLWLGGCSRQIFQIWICML